MSLIQRLANTGKSLLAGAAILGLAGSFQAEEILEKREEKTTNIFPNMEKVVEIYGLRQELDKKGDILANNITGSNIILFNSYIDINENGKLDDGDKAIRKEGDFNFYRNEAVFFHIKEEEFLNEEIIITIIDENLARRGRIEGITNGIIYNQSGKIREEAGKEKYIYYDNFNFPSYHEFLRKSGFLEGYYKRAYTFVLAVKSEKVPGMAKRVYQPRTIFVDTKDKRSFLKEKKEDKDKGLVKEEKWKT